MKKVRFKEVPIGGEFYDRICETVMQKRSPSMAVSKRDSIMSIEYDPQEIVIIQERLQKPEFPGEMPPKERTILTPECHAKLEEHTYYIVDVAFNVANPVHRRILYVGFIPEGKKHPLSGGYTCLMQSDSAEGRLRDLHYLKIVAKIEGI